VAEAEWTHVTGRRGNVGRKRRRLCVEHAARFRSTHMDEQT